MIEAIINSSLDNFYIFQDGPRTGNLDDEAKCAQVRQVIEEVGKRIEATTTIHKYFSDVNLGCGLGPVTALNWFFEENEYGIIIEDDAVPHPDFFPFCNELLHQYNGDSSVRAIGSMHIDNRSYGDGSFYFSMMNRTFCAWATWARAWKDFDLYHRSVSRKQLDQCLKWYGCDLRMREYWCERLSEVQKDAYHGSSWDQQFWISIWLHHGKGIMPNVNLSTNIGFGEGATHTFDEESIGANRITSPILPLQHPSSESIQTQADIRFQRLYFSPNEYGLSGLRRLPYRLNKRIKRMVGHNGSWIR